jgi:hypothetical protein
MAVRGWLGSVSKRDSCKGGPLRAAAYNNLVGHIIRKATEASLPCHNNRWAERAAAGLTAGDGFSLRAHMAATIAAW